MRNLKVLGKIKEDEHNQSSINKYRATSAFAPNNILAIQPSIFTLRINITNIFNAVKMVKE